MARFPAYDPTAVPFKKVHGTNRQQLRYGEAGRWWNSTRGDLVSACFPAVTTVIEHQLTGSDPSTGTWTVTVTPVSTQSGSAGADGLAAASISVAATADDLDDVVAALVTAAETGATLTDASDLASWTRFNSYVALTQKDGALDTLVFTARNSGTSFSVSITAPGGNGSTETVVSSPGSTDIAVGLYVAIDTSKGTNGYNEKGQMFIKPVTSATPDAEIYGPVYLGDGTEALEPGDLYRKYGQGSMLSVVSYGQCLAYADKAIPASSIGSAVYVRHTTSGNLRAGVASDATGAAAGATANLWTGTPTVTNSVLYVVDIAFEGKQITLKYTSDGSAADTEIVTGLKAQLALHNTSTGPLYGITATSATTTFVLQGPADGRGFTPSSVGSAGAIAWVETTAEVSTHTKLTTRGDRWLAASQAVGSAPVDVPHTNA